MTRADDTGPAPCVDQRAAAANAAHPDAIVSIHGDGGPASGHGFHVNYSAPPLNDAQSRRRRSQLATAMRDALVSSGLTASTYIGSGGLYGRADLAGLNLAEYPAVLVELGQHAQRRRRCPHDELTKGRAEYAAAVVKGITAYLGVLTTRASAPLPLGLDPSVGGDSRLAACLLRCSRSVTSPG